MEIFDNCRQFKSIFYPLWSFCHYCMETKGDVTSPNVLTGSLFCRRRLAVLFSTGIFLLDVGGGHQSITWIGESLSSYQPVKNVLPLRLGWVSFFYFFCSRLVADLSQCIREFEFRNQGNVCLWNPESGEIFFAESSNTELWHPKYSSKNPESLRRLESRIHSKSNTEKPRKYGPKVAIESVRINGVSGLSRLNLKKI